MKKKSLLPLSNSDYIHFKDPIGDGTWRSVWWLKVGNKSHIYEQGFGKKPFPPRRVRDKKEIESLTWYFQRYYPNGARI